MFIIPDWMKKYDVSSIDMSTISTTTLLVKIKFGIGDSFEGIKQITPNLFDEIQDEVHKIGTIKDRKKKLLKIKNNVRYGYFR